MAQPYFDFVAIGAGMFGSAAAKYLSQNQASVALVGPEEPSNAQKLFQAQVFGAYYDEARITRRLGWDEVWAATDSRSLNRFCEIEAESKISFFHECGSLIVMAKSIMHRTESILKHCEEQGIPVERMSDDSIEYHWPYLKMPSIQGGVEGLFESHMAGYLNPRQLVSAQLSLFKRHGGTLLRGTVMGLSKKSALWELKVAQEDGTTTLYAKNVLIAAGAFINHHSLLPEGYKLQLHTFTEPNLLFEVDVKDLTQFRNMPTLITVDPEDTGDKNLSIYLLPPIKYPDNKWYLRIGPGMQPIVEELTTLEQMRQWIIQQKITPAQRHFLIKMQKILMPDIQVKSIREACCIIEKTPSHYPYIGQINEDASLQVVTGGNGHGARGSDEIGRLAANLVLGNQWDFPIEQDRFKPILLSTEAMRRVIFESRPPFGLC